MKKASGGNTIPTVTLMTISKSQLPGTRRLFGAIILVAVVVVAVVITFGRQGGRDGSTDRMPLFAVRRGPLTISVAEAGTIKAREQEILKSEVEGQTTIIYLVAEGTRVKKEQLLVQLDSSNLEDKKVDQQIRVQNAEASFIRARENLEVDKNQAESDVAKAELEYRFAGDDLSQYVEGEFPLLLKEAESKITLAAEELERATEKRKWSQRLFDEKYISQTELEADKLTRNRAQLDHELAVSARDLLGDYTRKRKLAELESDVEQTRMALERVRRKARADVVQAKAELNAAEAEFRRQQEKLAKIEQQIEKTRIFAPTDGMVIYATSAKGSWRGNAEPLDEGQSVRERQELIYLPTADSMMAEVKIHESSLAKVRLDLAVRITVDALPGQVFRGRVAKIAPLPDAQSLWLNPDLKVFSTLIHVEGDGKGLRTGMSCRAEIVTEHYADAVYVPVQAVVRVGGTPMVYVMEGKEAEAVPIEMGLDNNRMIRIVRGLVEGQRVLLTPPLATASAPVEQDPLETTGPELDGASAAETAPRQVRAAPKPGDGENLGAESMGGRRTLTPEEREKMRRLVQNLPPEEREKLRQQRRSRRSSRRPGSSGTERER